MPPATPPPPEPPEQAGLDPTALLHPRAASAAVGPPQGRFTPADVLLIHRAEGPPVRLLHDQQQGSRLEPPWPPPPAPWRLPWPYSDPRLLMLKAQAKSRVPTPVPSG